MVFIKLVGRSSEKKRERERSCFFHTFLDFSQLGGPGNDFPLLKQWPSFTLGGLSIETV